MFSISSNTLSQAGFVDLVALSASNPIPIECWCAIQQAVLQSTKDLPPTSK